MISSWKKIIRSTGIQLIFKGTFGTLNNLIFFNIFGPAALSIIKISEIFIALPQFLTLGSSNFFIKESLKKSDKNLLNTFFTQKFMACIFLSSFLIADKLVFGYLEAFSWLQICLLISLLFSTTYYNVLVSSNFIQGKIHKIPLINSLVIAISPILTFTLGSLFFIDGWFYISLVSIAIMIILLLSSLGNSRYAFRILKFRHIPFSLFRKMIHESSLYFLNSKAVFLAELTLFVALIKYLDSITLGLLAFCFRFINLFDKLIAQIIQKRFFWENLSNQTNSEKLDNESSKKILILALMLTVILPIAIPLVIVLVSFFLLKYQDVLAIFPFVAVIIYCELISNDFLRKFFIQNSQRKLIHTLILFSLLIGLLTHLILGHDLNLMVIMQFISLVWVIRFIFILLISKEQFIVWGSLLLILFFLGLFAFCMSYFLIGEKLQIILVLSLAMFVIFIGLVFCFLNFIKTNKIRLSIK